MRKIISRHVSDRRLLTLAKFLDKLPPRRFDFNRWVGDDWEGAKDLSCGTNACALGWATTMPLFRRLGLRLMQPAGSYGFPALPDNIFSGTVAALIAAERIFGIKPEQAEGLFLPGEILFVTPAKYIHAAPTRASAKYVARRIRKFVKMRRRIEKR